VTHGVWQRRAVEIRVTNPLALAQRLEVLAIGEALLIALDEVELMFRKGD